MTTIHHPAPQPGLTSFAVYEDPHDREPMSPTEIYAGDDSYHSERSFAMADDVAHSIELHNGPEDEPQPYRSSYTSRNSVSQPRPSSHYSFVSAVPSDSSILSKSMLPANEAGARARKERPRFRNSESGRNIHMSSPPPVLAHQSSHERLKGSFKLTTPIRNGGAERPGSRQSGSRRRSIREPHSPRPTPTPTQAPLVLLHVTILPMQLPYSHDIMARIMPDWLVENYKLLEEKLQDIILMRRGLLIPHPRDEYDLLEERILESLELKTPRILPCGHFVPPEDDDDDQEDDDELSSVAGETTGRGSRMSGGTLTEASNPSVNGDHSTCTDCHRQLKKPGKGIGAGTRKWDIKIYAANGLMRAAAWTACWNDMERCDVEIHPWVPEEVRKTLEKRAQEEQEADKRKDMYTVELQRQIQEAAAKTKLLEEEARAKKRQEEAELQKSFEEAAAALQRSIEEKAVEKKKFQEDLEAKLQEAKEAVRLELEAKALAESDAVADRFRALETLLKEKERNEAAMHAASSQSGTSQVPLSTLARNYFLILLSDKRNLVIILLGTVVAYLSMNMTLGQQALTTQMLELPNEMVMADMPNAVTATMTATSYSTFTVTEFQTASITQETAVPVAIVAEPETEVPEAIIAEPEVIDVVADKSSIPITPAVEDDALPTSPAVELLHAASQTAPVTEIKMELASSPEPVEAHVVEDISNNSHAPVIMKSCVLEPVFQLGPAHCAASQL
ncbi:pathway-specific nitrogen regulator [Pyrenophora seminiperda CCB06]|uniref:Pathway-specific nitrogen regulator n=1 Tax=Pyrenophora seminiperda CCB06 TaxID=1302712 RepID=A0A3M7M2H0_9PLEO|nr:pathway-specific nitrogen regulator [Pyrenophora seminiperda CCB06]